MVAAHFLWDIKLLEKFLKHFAHFGFYFNKILDTNGLLLYMIMQKQVHFI